MLKKVMLWAFVAFLIYYVATDPTAAAGTTTGILDWMHSAASSLAQFASHIGK